MQKQKENFNSNQFQDTDTINIREELEKYIIHWKWFLLGGVLALLLAFVYLRYSTPKYKATTSIMIKDNQKSGISKELEAFKDMGIVGGGSTNNTDNEIEILKSRKVIGNVVDSLSLTISYLSEGRVKKSEVYKKSPFVLKFIEKNKNFAD
jgi:uncharacterized protein involved in exopolysaccharide biosynthesis